MHVHKKPKTLNKSKLWPSNGPLMEFLEQCSWYTPDLEEATKCVNEKREVAGLRKINRTQLANRLRLLRQHYSISATSSGGARSSYQSGPSQPEAFLSAQIAEPMMDPMMDVTSDTESEGENDDIVYIDDEVEETPGEQTRKRDHARNLREAYNDRKHELANALQLRHLNNEPCTAPHRDGTKCCTTAEFRYPITYNLLTHSTISCSLPLT